MTGQSLVVPSQPLDYAGRLEAKLARVEVSELGRWVAFNLSEDDDLSIDLATERVKDWLNKPLKIYGFASKRDEVLTQSGPSIGFVTVLKTVDEQGQIHFLTTTSGPLVDKLVDLFSNGRFERHGFIHCRIVEYRGNGNEFFTLAPLTTETEKPITVTPTKRGKK